jgi:thiol-disulfide isomerase/thioredoxin
VLCGAIAAIALAHWAYHRVDAWRSGALTQEVRAVALPVLKAPVISGVGVKGDLFTTATLGGKPFLISFWASWCPPCVEEMPSFLRYAARARTQGVEVLAVSGDKGWADVHKFFSGMKLQTEKLPMTVIMDRESVASRAYGTDKLPETYLVDSKGVIVKKFIGAQNWDSEEALKWLASAH